MKRTVSACSNEMYKEDSSEMYKDSSEMYRVAAMKCTGLQQ